MKQTDRAEMQFFEGFEWAVPTAFAAALSAHRFEEGDVLFRDRGAYAEVKAGKIRGMDQAIQVLHPPRSARSAPAGGDGDRKRASWEGEVQIELIDLAAGTREARRITQGKLLMALWRGEEHWLDPESEAPPMPRASRELAQQLPAAIPAIEVHQSSGSGCRFVFVLDRASDASRVKAKAIFEALSALGPVECLDLAPGEAGIEGADTFHPALAVRALWVAGGSVDAAESVLKSRLYAGQTTSTEEEGGEDEEVPTPADASADSKPKSDRFSIARHGLLEAT